MQQVLIPFTDVPKSVLKNLLLDRSIVYYTSEDELYIKNKGEFYKVSKGEGLNINISENKVFSLEDNILVNSTKVQNEDMPFYYNEYLGEVSPTKQILLIIDVLQGGGIGGYIQIVGQSISAAYRLCVSPNGDFDMEGASTFSSKDEIVKVNYNGREYIGIAFAHNLPCSVYLQGFDSRNYSLKDLVYTDNELTVL